MWAFGQDVKKLHAKIGPFYGSQNIRNELYSRGYPVGHDRVRISIWIMKRRFFLNNITSKKLDGVSTFSGLDQGRWTDYIIIHYEINGLRIKSQLLKSCQCTMALQPGVVQKNEII